MSGLSIGIYLTSSTTASVAVVPYANLPNPDPSTSYTRHNVSPFPPPNTPSSFDHLKTLRVARKSQWRFLIITALCTRHDRSDRETQKSAPRYTRWQPSIPFLSHGSLKPCRAYKRGWRTGML
ncbi:hypothetical protein BDR22DRAFT_378022 [Usnea florida]